MFLIQGEAEVIAKLFTDPLSVLHPFTLLPIAGQILLLVTLFQESPSRVLTWLGMGSIGLLLLLVFAIGVMTLHPGITLSAVPFLAVSVLIVRHHRAERLQKRNGGSKP